MLIKKLPYTYIVIFLILLSTVIFIRYNLKFYAILRFIQRPKQGCGGTFSTTRDEPGSLNIDSHDFLQANLDCGWMIHATEPDQIIKISFESFDLKMPSNGSCDYEYLEVREYVNDGPVIGRYCGNTQPRPIMTNANQVFIHFHKDETENTFDFRLTFELMPSPCGPSTLISSTKVQTLKSPSYPNAYPINLRCKWTIKSNYTGSTYAAIMVEVMITDIDIPCGGDYLEIKRAGVYWQPKYVPLRYCSNNSTQVENYRTLVYVAFNSDGINNGGRGFSLTYKNANCNRTYTADYGVISSTSYAGRESSNSVCLMHVTAATGKTIALYFRQFSLLLSEDCSLSYMKIYDGNSDTSPLLAHYCGIMPPNPVFSTSNELYIKVNKHHGIGLYQISYLTTDKGRGCGGSITSSEGTVSSPLYPQPYNQTGECLWYIVVPGYHTVQLSTTNFALTSTSGCNTNYLEIYTGKVPDAPNRVVRYCGQDLPSHQELRSNEAVIKLVTDQTNDQSGFLIDFSSSDHAPENSAMNFVQRFDNEQ